MDFQILLLSVTDEFVMQSWLKSSSQGLLSIRSLKKNPYFPTDLAIFKMSVHRCCATQINLRRKSGNGAVIGAFVIGSIGNFLHSKLVFLFDFT